MRFGHVMCYMLELFLGWAINLLESCNHLEVEVHKLFSPKCPLYFYIFDTELQFIFLKI